MPMISCPACAAEVSDQASTCPKCGQPLRKARRGCFGALSLWAFWGWQALMIVWIVSYWGQVGPMMQSGSEAEQAGAALGTTIGTGMLLGFWAIGSVVFGLMALLTRPSK